MRDSQRSKVYSAEEAAFKDQSLWTPTPSIEDVEALVARIHKSARVLRLGFTRPNTMVGDGRGARRAASHCWKIVIPRWARKDWVVLHEMAHEIEPYHRRLMGRVNGVPVDDVGSHGWIFCMIYLDLVMWFMGREAHDALKASFKKLRVRFRKPREKRKLSPERREALVKQLAVARALRVAGNIENERMGQ